MTILHAPVSPACGAPGSRPWHSRDHRFRAAALVFAALMLAGCSSAPPPKPWQANAVAALAQSQNAYMDGDTGIARMELAQAREQVSRTGSPAELGRLELRHCAVEAASLNWSGCPAFAALQPAQDAASIAYYHYLLGQPLDATQRALLPTEQRNAAAFNTLSEPAIAAVGKIEAPLSRLLAASLLMHRAGDVSPELNTLAIDTASAQGWRRPLLAWLLLQQQWARTHGHQELLENTELRIRIIEDRGAAAAAAASPLQSGPETTPAPAAGRKQHRPE